MKDEQLLNNKNLTLPGSGIAFHKFKQPISSILNTFDNPLQGPNSLVTISTDEMTALCPLTGFPDQYKVVVSYIPKSTCIESKSSKFYFQSFRDYQGFIETIAQKIWEDFCEALQNTSVKVEIEMNPRGGVKINALVGRYS